jgi:hypothetical protein
VAGGVERWRLGTQRLDAPATHLSYDPHVATHVDALLAIAEALTRPSPPTP